MSRVEFVLVHSPLCGPFTWAGVAEHLRQVGHVAHRPTLRSIGRASSESFAEFHCRMILEQIGHRAGQTRYVLVSHSGAGALLPLLRTLIPNPAGMIFCDSDIPEDGKSRFDLMPDGVPQEFRSVVRDGKLPPLWTEDDLIDAIPDAQNRATFVSELTAIPVAVYEESIRVPPDGLIGRHIYVKFTDSYEQSYLRAGSMGWRREVLPGSHFHPINQPNQVADLLANLAHDVK